MKGNKGYIVAVLTFTVLMNSLSIWITHPLPAYLLCHLLSSAQFLHIYVCLHMSASGPLLCVGGRLIYPCLDVPCFITLVLCNPVIREINSYTSLSSSELFWLCSRPFIHYVNFEISLSTFFKKLCRELDFVHWIYVLILGEITSL